MIPVEFENARLKVALTILTGAPITVANDAIEMLPVVIDKTNNDLSNSQKKQYIASLLLINSLLLISEKTKSLISLILFSLNY